jgi:hypothetical protein
MVDAGWIDEVRAYCLSDMAQTGSSKARETPPTASGP